MFFYSLLVSIVVQFIQGACNKIVVRREIRDLSDSERINYFNAVKLLHSTENDVFSKFIDMYRDSITYIKDSPVYFPWFRQYLYLYEQELRKIDSNIVLPYWDWSLDYLKPEQSIVLSDKYLGGDGQNPNQCVTDGVFANWTATRPVTHCLKRDLDHGINSRTLYSTSSVQSLTLHIYTYHQFAENAIDFFIRRFRNYIGGDMKSPYFSNDPLFYLHQTFMDLVYNEWQVNNQVSDESYNDEDFKITEIMKSFNVSAQSVLDISELCYRYNWAGRFKPINLDGSAKLDIK